MLSNSQIDKLGDRLRSEVVDPAAVRELEEFRSSFAAAYQFVEWKLADTLNFRVTGRPSKSTVAIVEKLKREKTRLSQMQDIAGCRIVASDIPSQDKIVHTACVMLGDVTVVDRRDNPSHGYRAVHLIVRRDGRPVEVQVRTVFQHAWAEISEKISDTYGQQIKYGKGEPWAIEFLQTLSVMTQKIESLQADKLVAQEEKRLMRVKRGSQYQAVLRRIKSANEDARTVLRQINVLFSGIRNR